MKWILCIDDSSARYREFYIHALQRGYEVMISDDPTMVKMFIENHEKSIEGICLDHDMTQKNGTWFANEFIINRNIPVAIVSANPVGASNIASLFDDYGVDYTICPAGGRPFVSSILNFFERGK